MSLACWRPPCLPADEQRHLLGNSQFVVCFTLTLLKLPKGEEEGPHLEACFLENQQDLVVRTLEKSLQDAVLVSLVASALGAGKLWILIGFMSSYAR